MKDYGSPLTYHPGLSQTQHGALVKALINILIRLPAARKTTSNWSVAVQYYMTVYLMSLQTFPEIMPHIVEAIKMLEKASEDSSTKNEVISLSLMGQDKYPGLGKISGVGYIIYIRLNKNSGA